MGAVKYQTRHCGYRHGLAVLWFFGAIFKQATRVGLSVAMVDMVMPVTAAMKNVTFSQANDTIFIECTENIERDPGLNASVDQTTPLDGRLDWDSRAQGMLHGAFYYGYLVSQVPGGWLAHRYGATLPITISSIAIAVATMLSPLAAYAGIWVFFFARLVVGLATGVAFPAGMTFWGEWSPPLERGRLLGGAGSGTQLGTVFGMSFSGILAYYFGWESIFYCFGGLLLLWVVPWLALARDSPTLHPRISHEERNYIVTSIGKTVILSEKKTRHDIPWLAIFKTPAFYAILVVEFGHNWGVYTLLTNLPTYLSNIQHFSLRKNGFISALPYLVRWGGIAVVVTISDWMRTRNLLSATAARKLFSCSSFLLSSAALVGVGFAGCDSTVAVALLVIAVGVSSFVFGGHFVSYLEMSPEFGGIVVSMGNTFGTITGIAAPLVAGVLTTGTNGQTTENWRIVFLISAGMYVFISLVYLIFGSAKQQSWDPTGRQRQVLVMDNKEGQELLVDKEPCTTDKVKN